MEAVRKFKANPKLEGQACGWCLTGLRLGDDAAVCTACDGNHHGNCWDQRGGCAKAGCMNAPLPQIAAPSPQAAQAASLAAQGLMSCPRCTVALPIGTQVCLACKWITSPDGIYHGPKTNAPGAVKSLVFGLIGLVFCQVIFGPLAIAASGEAKRNMQMDPTLGGGGLATAGMVLGIVDLVLFVLVLFVNMSRM